MGLDETLNWTIFLVAGASIVASASILTIYFIFSEIQNFPMLLLMCMVCSNMVSTIALILPSETLCMTQAWLLQFASASSLIWGSLVAWALYKQIVNIDYSVDRHKATFFALGTGLPVLLTILPSSTSNYGPAQGWCWIEAQGSTYFIGTGFRLVCFAVPLLVCLSFNTAAYITVVKSISHELEGFVDQSKSVLAKRFLTYPVLLLTCYVFVLVKRAYDALYPEDPSDWLTFSAKLTLVMEGLLNFFAYGFNTALRRIVYRCFRRESLTYDSDSILNNILTSHNTVIRAAGQSLTNNL